jgi:hypothetical protein
MQVQQIAASAAQFALHVPHHAGAERQVAEGSQGAAGQHPVWHLRRRLGAPRPFAGHHRAFHFRQQSAQQGVGVRLHACIGRRHELGNV